MATAVSKKQQFIDKWLREALLEKRYELLEPICALGAQLSLDFFWSLIQRAVVEYTTRDFELLYKALNTTPDLNALRRSAFATQDADCRCVTILASESSYYSNRQPDQFRKLLCRLKEVGACITPTVLGNVAKRLYANCLTQGQTLAIVEVLSTELVAAKRSLAPLAGLVQPLFHAGQFTRGVELYQKLVALKVKPILSAEVIEFLLNAMDGKLLPEVLNFLSSEFSTQFTMAQKAIISGQMLQSLWWNAIPKNKISSEEAIQFLSVVMKFARPSQDQVTQALKRQRHVWPNLEDSRKIHLELMFNVFPALGYDYPECIKDGGNSGLHKAIARTKSPYLEMYMRLVDVVRTTEPDVLKMASLRDLAEATTRLRAVKKSKL